MIICCQSLEIYNKVKTISKEEAIDQKMYVLIKKPYQFEYKDHGLGGIGVLIIKLNPLYFNNRTSKTIVLTVPISTEL